MSENVAANHQDAKFKTFGYCADVLTSEILTTP
jgi:hypothetical protein